MLNEVQRQALAMFITPEEIASGGKFETIKLKDGSAVTMRIVVPSPGIRQSLLAKFIRTRDEKRNVLAILESNFANKAFLETLAPKSFQWLASIALAIIVGPERLRQTAEQGKATPEPLPIDVATEIVTGKTAEEMRDSHKN